MLTIAFWKDTGERAAKTTAQTLLSLFLVGDVAFNLFEFHWGPALGVAAGAAVISVLTSVMSAGVGPSSSPSLVGEGPRHAAP